MKRVLMLPDMEERTCNDSYAMRLVEQGKAVPAPQKAAPPPEKTEEDASGKSKGKRH